jgi:C-methyltransferase
MSMAATTPPARLARVVERVRHHLYRLHQRLVPPPAAMLETILAGWTSQAITVAAELGVADALAAGPLAIDDLAVRVDADADALGRLLRALISRGIFRRCRDGRFALNSLASTLRSDVTASMLSAARFYGSAEQRERWTLLADAVRAGTTVVPALRGAASFDYFAQRPELAELFDRTMTSISELTDAPIAAGYDFGGYPTIVDVGGGRGSLLAEILAAAPTSRGILFDQTRVVESDPKPLHDNDVSDRVQLVAGSFFDDVPRGGDVYVLKNVIHDWPDDAALQILRKVRVAAGVGATVLLIEFVIPDHDREFPGKWVDLEMLLNLGSRERTAGQYRELLSRAGFHMTRVVQTATPLSLVEARAR